MHERHLLRSVIETPTTPPLCPLTVYVHAVYYEKSDSTGDE